MRVLRAAQEVERLTQELETARGELRRTLREAREAGESVSELARRLNLSRARIQQLLRG